MRRLLVILVLAGVVLILAERYGPGGVQRRGMRAADRFRASITPALTSDPRFAAVDTMVVTHPSLRVYGEVPDGKALEDLKALAKAPPNAPFIVFFQVKVVDDENKKGDKNKKGDITHFHVPRMR